MLNEETVITFDNVKKFDFDSMAQTYMEDARKHHELYLLKGSRIELDSAVDSYIDAIKYNPNISEAYYRLASLLWDKGEINLSSAIEQCISAVNISPDNPNARIYAGYFLEMAKQYKEAEEEYKAAIKINPLKAARSRLSLASLYVEKMHNNGINVKDLYQSFYYMLSGSLSIALDYPSVKMLYKNIGKNLSVLFYDFLGSVYEKTKNYAKAVQTYDAAVNSVGRNDFYYKKIGDINIKNMDVQDARESYLKALENNPNDPDLLLKVANLTQSYFKDDLKTAIDCYSKLLELVEDNSKFYYELGHLYLKKEDFINSVNAFSMAIEKDYDNPFYHNALAYALVRAEQYEDACEHYRFAIDKNPNPEWTSIVCQAVASLYFKVFDDVDTAMSFLKTAIILDESNDEAFVELGDIYSACEDLDSSIKAYCEAIKLNPKNFSAYNKCAMVLWQKDYVEEAIIAYNKAININPDYYQAYNNLGVIYLDGIKNLKEAQRLFEKAISLNENYVMPYLNLGRVFEEKGQNIIAAKFYQKALELNNISGETDSEQIRKKLYGLFEV